MTTGNAVASVPQKLSELNKNVRHDLTPDPDWEQTGEIHRDTAGNQYPVYVEVERKEKRVPLRDADGAVLYHLRADGSRHRPMMTTEFAGDVRREFVYMPLGNGIVQKNYFFRPDPASVARLEAARAEENMVGDLARMLREANLTPSQIVAGLKNAAGIQPKVEQPVIDNGGDSTTPDPDADSDEDEL